LGRAAFQVLMRQLKGEDPLEKHTVIPVDIRIGQTTQRVIV
jgi:DNA-binding LacI/PurR family transcriptional regulator